MKKSGKLSSWSSSLRIVRMGKTLFFPYNPILPCASYNPAPNSAPNMVLIMPVIVTGFPVFSVLGRDGRSRKVRGGVKVPGRRAGAALPPALRERAGAGAGRCESRPGSSC